MKMMLSVSTRNSTEMAEAMSKPVQTTLVLPRLCKRSRCSVAVVVRVPRVDRTSSSAWLWDRLRSYLISSRVRDRQ